MTTLLPPPQYDHPPQIPVIEHVLPWSEVQLWCAKLATRTDSAKVEWIRKNGVVGCSAISPVDGKCWVFRVDDPLARRHELAHCNGWPADHPGGHE